ncbi:MAG TPA: hypothetical protein PKN57_00665 [Saprospiraceae bacterium]|nr:hypothetical protein [Saprospiraceae bacterium]MCC6687708.1 hypothetical protein [Saprospiraceae bacterium]HMX83691.1 hypothetical protein [Saprospiraceae bacterium]HMX86195.1 hypothetical protein [Saprospiraceae bacterium]HMZ72161.1 hypothetical protein [Saprospiraceae bacterium]
MLENWIESPDPGISKGCETETIGHFLSENSNIFESLESIKIAIISDKHPGNAHWRKAFYNLFNHFPNLHFADLGSLRKNNKECLTPVIKELLSGGIFPIIIAHDAALSEAMLVAYKTFGDKFKLLVADEKIRLSKTKNKKSYLNKLNEPDVRAYMIPSIIGHQIHFNSPEVLGLSEDLFYDQIRLGNLINNLSDAEPIIRDTDSFLFHLSAIKSSDAPAVAEPSPNGLSGFESCQLMRYAGFSDKLTSLGLFGLEHKNDLANQTAALIAQMIWYLIDGFYHRLKEFPISTANMQAYIVEQKHSDYSLKFWKSKISGRWWLQVPDKEVNSKGQHNLFPCTQSDYEEAINGEIPDRLFFALQKNI